MSLSAAGADFLYRRSLAERPTRLEKNVKSNNRGMRKTEAQVRRFCLEADSRICKFIEYLEFCCMQLYIQLACWDWLTYI